MKSFFLGGSFAFILAATLSDILDANSTLDINIAFVAAIVCAIVFTALHISDAITSKK